VAVVLGTLFAGEVITARVAIAALVIVGSVALIITSRSKPSRSAAPAKQGWEGEARSEAS